ncbi:hypothetical protein ACW73L_19730 [Methylolobus aquaticus]
MHAVQYSQTDLFPEQQHKGVPQRLALLEDCAAAIDQLFQQALETEGDHAFDGFLQFMSGFSGLSPYNAMLVMVQRRGAVAVGSRRQWASIGRYVRPDAVPIVLLQSFGPVRFVYEFADTEGKEVPGEKLNSLFAEGELPMERYQRTCAAAANYAVQVKETDLYGTLLAGTASAMARLPDTLAPSAKNAARFRVKVNAKHDLPTRFATLAHELGHIYCGHLGADCKGRWPDRSDLDLARMELEAEAVAWLVCQRTGISPRSREYLSSLATAEHIAAVSPYAIFEAANRVESRTAPR